MRMGADWARIGTLSRNRYFSARIRNSHSRFEDVRSWPKANFRQGAIGLIEVEWTFSANVTHVSCRPWLCEKTRPAMIPFMILRG